MMMGQQHLIKEQLPPLTNNLPVTRTYNLPSAEARTRQFLSEVSFIIEHKSLPNIYWRRDAAKGIDHEDWVPFLSLATRVMSTNSVTPTVSYWFERFLAIVPVLSEHSVEAISLALTSEHMRFHSMRPRSDIVDCLLRAIDSFADVKRLLEQIAILERVTAVEPRRVRARYEVDHLADLPTVKNFMESEMMEMKMIAPSGWLAAKMFIDSLAERLPEGVKLVYKAEGERSFIWITKPFKGERAKRLEYESALELLQTCKHELSKIQLGLHARDLTGRAEGS